MITLTTVPRATKDLVSSFGVTHEGGVKGYRTTVVACYGIGCRSSVSDVCWLRGYSSHPTPDFDGVVKCDLMNNLIA